MTYIASDENNRSQVAAAQRLGFLFDRLGMQKPARRVARWLDGKRVALQPLVLQGSDESPGEQSDRTWRIRYASRQLAMLEEL